MTLAFVGLGANLGDPRAAVEDAFRALAGLGPLRASPLYRTEPLGDRGDPWYVNAVAEIRTDLEPAELLAQLLEFERRAGRSRSSETARWAPRRLDLDLLLYGDWQIDTAALRVPHPGLARRRFVLEPLAELAPDLAVPGTGFSVRQLLAALDDPLQVEKLPPDHGSQTTRGPEVPPT